MGEWTPGGECFEESRFSYPGGWKLVIQGGLWVS